jgi:hypothetical protein
MKSVVGGRCLAVGRGKGLCAPAPALHSCGRRFAPTSLRCSRARAAAQLATFTAFTLLKQVPQVSSRSACVPSAHAQPAPTALLGARQARRRRGTQAFARHRAPDRMFFSGLINRGA